MCGIVGIVDSTRAPRREELQTMAATLAHRGPDGSGYRLAGSAGLAQTRLAIIDPDGGAQPMGDEGGRYWLVYNGELFNYIELREELERDGVAFRSRSDTEVVLRHLIAHGPAGLSAMNGQWALALWDSREESLLLARDRFGIRPLHFCWRGRRFFFASEIKALLAHPEVSGEVDHDVLAGVFRYWSPPSGRSVFRGIDELPAGHWARLDSGGLRTERWWRFPFGAARSGIQDPQEAAAGLREKLHRATALRLRADLPVGAYVSGGLDSSLLAALVKDENQGMHTFSLRFENPLFDEGDEQKAMIRSLGSRHHSLKVTESDLADAFRRFIRHTEKPVIRSAGVPLMLLADEVARNGFKVVLTGEGADEVLAGYDLFKDAKIRHWWARQPDSRLRPLLLARLYPTLPLLARAGQLEYLRSYYGRWISRPGDPVFSHRPRWEMTDGVLDLYLAHPARKDDADLIADLPGGFGDRDILDRAQLIEAETLLTGYLLSSQGDRPAMAASIETRYPYLDPELVDFVAGLSPRLRLPVLRDKALLRDAAEGLVPESIRHRAKQPYMAPDTVCFLGEHHREWVGDLLAPAKIRDYGLFAPKAVDALLGKLRGRTGDKTSFRDNMLFMGILSAQVLVDELCGPATAGGSLTNFTESLPLGGEKH